MSNEHTKLILFDLDGTLIDSLSDICHAANQALAGLSMAPHPLESYRYFVGNGLNTLVKRIVRPGSSADEEHLVAEGFKSFYQNNWNHRTRPYPGISSMLETLIDRQTRIAVLSNKPEAFTRACIDEFFPDIHFDMVQGQRENIPLKPDAQGALSIAEKCGLKPPSCLFVGDSSVDIQTGRAAGMNTAGVSWGFRDRIELEQAGADIIINKPEDLIHHVYRTV